MVYLECLCFLVQKIDLQYGIVIFNFMARVAISVLLQTVLQHSTFFLIMFKMIFVDFVERKKKLGLD